MKFQTLVFLIALVTTVSFFADAEDSETTIEGIIAGDQAGASNEVHDLTSAQCPEYKSDVAICNESDCWKHRNLRQRIAKVISNTFELNRLHSTNINPAMFVCLGWKESRFDPGAYGTAHDTGMFQIVPDTANGAVDDDTRFKIGPQVPGFTSFNTDNCKYDSDGDGKLESMRCGLAYRKLMRTSTLAQQELSLLTFEMKYSESVNSDDVHNAFKRILYENSKNPDDYRIAFGRYNGSGKNGQYADRAGSCMHCMIDAGLPGRKTEFSDDEMTKMKECLSWDYSDGMYPQDKVNYDEDLDASCLKD